MFDITSSFRGLLAVAAEKPSHCRIFFIILSCPPGMPGASFIRCLELQSSPQEASPFCALVMMSPYPYRNGGALTKVNKVKCLMLTLARGAVTQSSGHVDWL